MLQEFKLIPTEELNKLSNVIYKQTDLWSLELHQPYLKHSDYGKEFRIYVALHYFDSIFNRSQEQMIYNAYFWYGRFKAKHNKVHGESDALTIAHTRILEDFDHIDVEINWDIIEQLDTLSQEI